MARRSIYENSACIAIAIAPTTASPPNASPIRIDEPALISRSADAFVAGIQEATTGGRDALASVCVACIRRSAQGRKGSLTTPFGSPDQSLKS